MPAQSTIKLRRDTSSNWTSTNPTLSAGEIGVETNTGKFKIGTGSTAWTSLPYIVESFPIDSLSDVVIDGTPANNEVLAYDTATSKWINKTPTEAGLATTVGYSYLQTVYFTASGTFTKANYSGIRAVRVRCIGGGGGGGGAATTGASQVANGAGGSGANYAEKFLLASALGTTETVTVGAGGAGGTAGGNAGTDGGNSSFGTLVVAVGGNGGGGGVATTVPDFDSGTSPNTTGDVGDIIILGEASGVRNQLNATDTYTNVGGGTAMFPNAEPPSAVTTGASGGSVSSTNKGCGGTGGTNTQSQTTARSGSAGAIGIVIVDVYV
jgi:hypothetical protein